jgi:hypothetical protein
MLISSQSGDFLAQKNNAVSITLGLKLEVGIADLIAHHVLAVTFPARHRVSNVASHMLLFRYDEIQG